MGKLGCADSAIEQEIQAKGLTAPRVSLADINANIASEHYFTAADGARMSSHGNHPIHNLNTGSLGLLTFCVLVLRNGFTVTGESACASPENFDAEIGRKISRENAVEKIWPLMGYELRSRLHEASRTCTCGPNEGCTRCHVGMSGD
ncbi:Gp49 family protein [uncultured Pseudomonas sp.]|uniref:Gp49 family protein n=1 Tax=uncultured Pseudomonas sp. TaxID=114707 RepID=UPI0030D7047C